MSLSVGDLVLGQFRVERVGGRSGSLLLAEGAARDGGPVRLVTLTLDGSARVDVHEVLERARRLTLGVPNLARAIAAEVERSAGADPRLLVVYATERAPTLAERLHAGERFAEASVARVAHAIAAALAPLHDQGIAHGAIGPELIVADGDRVLLLGQGLLPLSDALGGPRLASALLPGAFVAPELRGAVARRPEPWSDTYAFGVLCATLLAGRAPAEGDPVTPRALGADVSDDVERLVAQCVSPSVAARPRDLERLARELDEALRESAARAPAPPLASPVSPAPRTDEPPTTAPPMSDRQDSLAEAPEPAAPPPPPPAANLPALPPPRPAAVRRAVELAPPAPRAPRRIVEERRSWLAVAMLVGGVLLMAGGVVIGLSMAALRSSPVPAASVASPLTGAGGAEPFDPGELGGGDPSGAPAVVAAPSASAEASLSEELARGPAVRGDAGGAEPPATISAGDALSALPLDARLPSLGPPAAPVTIVIFGDLECPHTRRMIRLLASARERAPADLRLVWRHRPLEVHPLARAASRVAATLYDQHGALAFWRLLDQVARGAAPADAAHLATWVAQAGGSAAETGVWLAKATGAARVDDDLELAARFAVRATPTSFVNGERVDGTPSPDEFEALIDAERSASRRAISSGVLAGDLYRTRVDENLIGLKPSRR